MRSLPRAGIRAVFLEEEDEEIDSEIMSLGYEMSERDGSASGSRRR